MTSQPSFFTCLYLVTQMPRQPSRGMRRSPCSLERKQYRERNTLDTAQPIQPSLLHAPFVNAVLATKHVHSQKRQFLPSNVAGAIRLFPASYQGLLACGKAGCPDHEGFFRLPPSAIRLVSRCVPSSPAILTV